MFAPNGTVRGHLVKIYRRLFRYSLLVITESLIYSPAFYEFMKKTYTLRTLGAVVVGACLSFVPYSWNSAPEKLADGRTRIIRYERSLVSYLFSKARFTEVTGGQQIITRGPTRIDLFFGRDGKTENVETELYPVGEWILSGDPRKRISWHYSEPNRSCMQFMANNGGVQDGDCQSCESLAIKGSPHPEETAGLIKLADSLLQKRN